MKNTTLNGMNKNRQVLYLHPKMVSGVVFVLLMLIGLFITILGFQNLKQNDEQELDYILSILERNIQQTLNNCYSATLTLALTIDKDGISQNFDSVSSQIIRQNKFIDVLQLVPNGVIKYVYPMEGNEVVIDYDILKDRLTEKEARQALESREMFFAGPFTLKQGGVAVIARLPIFINNKFPKLIVYEIVRIGNLNAGYSSLINNTWTST
jgi:sensor domain CHASE-containing protein